MAESLCCNLLAFERGYGATATPIRRPINWTLNTTRTCSEPIELARFHLETPRHGATVRTDNVAVASRRMNMTCADDRPTGRYRAGRRREDTCVCGRRVFSWPRRSVTAQPDSIQALLLGNQIGFIVYTDLQTDTNHIVDTW